MLIKKRPNWTLPESSVTPEAVYLSRRNFMRGGTAIASSALLTACRPERPQELKGSLPSTGEEATNLQKTVSATTDELGDSLTDFQDIISYNNYYEFTTDKREVAAKSEAFVTSPWQIEIGGLVNKPGVYDMDDLLNIEQQERIYRLRCVEAWSMVVPWLGFPLSTLLNKVEPTSKATYVAFQTLDAPDQFPGVGGLFDTYDWPYKEGLRLDEAMNDLTLMATGIYGLPLLPQNGAPIRLVVPWKYGFKSIKSIVKIMLVDEQPPTLWNTANAREYGFYSNVNPSVDHPRWTQSSERRIGEGGRRPTLPFNGYSEQVASLYNGMDLSVYI